MYDALWASCSAVSAQPAGLQAMLTRTPDPFITRLPGYRAVESGALRIGDASIRRPAVIFLSRASITTRGSEDDRSFSVLALLSTAARSGATRVGRDAVARTQDADPLWPPVRHPDDHRSSLTEA